MAILRIPEKGTLNQTNILSLAQGCFTEYLFFPSVIMSLFFWFLN